MKDSFRPLDEVSNSLAETVSFDDPSGFITSVYKIGRHVEDLLYVEYTISPEHTQQGTLIKFNTLEERQMFLSKQLNLEDQTALQPERYVASWEEANGLKGTFIQINERVRISTTITPSSQPRTLKSHKIESACTYNELAFNILGNITKALADCPHIHGNLRNGVCITQQNHAYLWNFPQHSQSQQVWHKNSDDPYYLINQIYEGRTLDLQTVINSSNVRPSYL